MKNQMNRLSSVLFGAVALTCACLVPVSAQPAGDLWTEKTSAAGVYTWGNFNGGQTSITADSESKRVGEHSIKYAGAANANGGALSPTLIFPAGKYLDTSAFAGGKFRFEVEVTDATNLKFMQLVLMSDGIPTRQIFRNINLQAGWNRLEVPYAAKGKFKEAGWQGAQADEFNPSAVHQVRFRFIYMKGSEYDSAKPRDIRFDGVGFTQAAPEAVAGLNITNSRQLASELVIKPGQTQKVELPQLDGSETRLLRVTVRREAARLGGYAPYLHMAFNGQPLDASKNRYEPRLLNKPLAFSRATGEQVFWNRGDGIWLTIFSPDFQTDFRRYGADVAQPYSYVLDISDLLRAHGGNELELSSYIPITPEASNIIASVELLTAPPATGNTVHSPRPRIDTKPDFKVAADGALELQVEGKPLRVLSTFSVPHGGQNQLGGASHEQAWKPRVTRHSATKWTVEAQGAYYRLVREINQVDGRISVRDTWHNPTKDDVGIIFSNALDLAQHPSIDYCRIGGSRGQGVNEVQSRENPTLFFPLNNSSLTMIAEDDVQRNQAVFYFDAGQRKSGIRNPMFALGPNANYTMEWSLYTLPSPDYFDMINRVRNDWNANATLKGPVYFANYRSIAGMPLEQVRKLVATHDARYICFWELRTPENQPDWNNQKVVAFGTGVHEPIFKPEIELLKQAIAKLKAVNPEIKVSLYSHSFFISPEKADDKRFEDSWVTNARGARSASVYSATDFFRYQTAYPTLKNSYGEAYLKILDFYLDELKLDWIYWDESNGPGVTVDEGDRLESFLTYNAWDGHSAKIDPQTGLIQQKCAFLTLLCDDFMDAAVEKVEKKGGFVLFNGAATTKRRLRSPSFVETQWDITQNYRTHLNAPLAYGPGNPTVNDLRRRANLGTIYARTHLDYNSTVIAKTYPFTPVELHEGWVKSKERIITSRSGSFGWEQPFKAKLYLYDGEGKLTTTQAYDTVQKSVSVTVPEGGIAILERVE